MKLRYLLILFILQGRIALSVESGSAEIYLLTCGPGTELYSIYGHSALRVVVPEKHIDVVYNWGVFDFSTPNFALKFARGRLNYMLDTGSYRRFLRDYFSEKRWVVSQKINLDSTDIPKLFQLLTENLKPENINYRYDFFKDNCSTRIRDILEKTLDASLKYPPDIDRRKLQSFRYLSGEYEKVMPWTKVGIDLLLGSPSDKKATFRDRMFLPIDLKNGLSELRVNKDGKMIPLLRNPDTVLSFESPVIKENFFTSPLFIFTLLFIVIVIFTTNIRTRKANDIFDIAFFTLFSILALLMIFVNFFSAHLQLKWNLNIIWLSPFIFLCLTSLLFKKDQTSWFMIVFILAVGFLALIVFLPQAINNAYVPVILALILRCSVRSGFSWNPLTLPFLTEL